MLHPHAPYLKTGDTTLQVPILDKVTHSIVYTSYPHREIHEGDSYTICQVVACDTTTKKWMIVTPNTSSFAHVVFDLRCTGEATYLITGDADRTAGSAIVGVNRNRTGTIKTATTTVSSTPSGGTTDGATVLLNIRDGATGAASKTIMTSSTRDDNEFVLKPNTKYVISITTYAAVYVTVKLDWYEHVSRSA